jgi:crossover junction endodeoxyribonuclease RuvC
MYALGKGVGTKDAVLAAAIERYRHLVTIDQNDVADATVLLAMGCRQIGRSLETSLPLTHLRAMAKVDWPAGAVAA